MSMMFDLLLLLKIDINKFSNIIALSVNIIPSLINYY